MGYVRQKMAASPRVILVGDSYCVWARTRLFVHCMAGLSTNRVTAFSRGFNNTPTPPTGPAYSDEIGAGGTGYSVNQANDNEVLTGEYFGLAGPMGDIRVIPFNGTQQFGGSGAFCRIGANNDLTPHSGDLFTDGAGSSMAVRVLYYCPTDIADLNDRNIRVHDREATAGQTVTTTANLTTGARRFHHLGEGDPAATSRGAPVVGHINALFPDYVADNPSDNERSILLIDQSYASGATPNTGKFNPLAGAVYYDVDGSGDWVPGEYWQVLAESGLGYYLGYDTDAQADAGSPRVFTEAQLRHYLDATTIDPDQPTLVIFTGDNEDRTEAQLKQAFIDTVGKFRTSFDAIGVSDYHFLLMHAWRRDVAAETGATEIATNNLMGDGMYAAAQQMPDCSFLSLQKLLGDAYMDGGAEADASIAALGLDPLTFGTVQNQTVTGKDMISDGTHPSDETSAAFYAAVANYGIQTIDISSRPTMQFEITLDATLFPATLSNYPAWISSALFTPAQVAAIINAGVDNVWFSTDLAGQLPIDAVEAHSSASSFAFYAEVPEGSSSTGATIYLNVGNKPDGYGTNPFYAQDAQIMPMADDFLDLTSNGNDGTAGGSIVAGGATGPDGSTPATVFDGADDRVSVGSLVTAGNDNSVGVWVNHTPAGEPSALAYLFGTSSANRFYLLHMNTGQIRGLVDGTTAATGSNVGDGWKYLSLSYDNTAGTFKVFVNGVQGASATDTLLGTPAGQNFGSFNNSTSNSFTGNMALGLIANRNVTADEWRTNYLIQGPDAASYVEVRQVATSSTLRRGKYGIGLGLGFGL